MANSFQSLSDETPRGFLESGRIESNIGTTETELRYRNTDYLELIENYNLRLYDDLLDDIEGLQSEIKNGYSDFENSEFSFEFTLDFIVELYEELIKNSLFPKLPIIDVYGNSIDIHIKDPRFSVLLNLDHKQFTYTVLIKGEETVDRSSGSLSIWRAYSTIPVLVTILKQFATKW